MAGAVGLREVRYGYAGENHLDAPKDESNPYFTFDGSKCIVCSRCVRACEENPGDFRSSHHVSAGATEIRREPKQKAEHGLWASWWSGPQRAANSCGTTEC